MASGICGESPLTADAINFKALQEHLENPRGSFMTLKEGHLVCLSQDHDEDYDTSTDPLLQQIEIEYTSPTQRTYTQIVCDPNFGKQIVELLQNEPRTIDVIRNIEVVTNIEWIDKEDIENIDHRNTTKPLDTQKSIIFRVLHAVKNFFSDIGARITTRLDTARLNAAERLAEKIATIDLSMIITIKELEESNKKLKDFEEDLSKLLKEPQSDSDLREKTIDQMDQMSYFIRSEFSKLDALAEKFYRQLYEKNSCRESASKILKPSVERLKQKPEEPLTQIQDRVNQLFKHMQFEDSNDEKGESLVKSGFSYREKNCCIGIFPLRCHL